MQRDSYYSYRTKFALSNLQDDVEFRNKMRPLKIRLLDNSVKTIIVDESLPVEKIMPTICERIGKNETRSYLTV